MSSFQSFLAHHLDDYLAYRDALGYSLRTTRCHLLTFDRYLIRVNAHWDCLQPYFFVQMGANLQMQPRIINDVISAIRVFFQFLIRKGKLCKNPLQDVPRLKHHHFVPFVFSPQQTEQLLDTVARRIRKTPSTFLPDLGIYVALLLLARCGMRISEPLKLLRQHYRRDEATVLIDKTKFMKQRLIPLPKTAITAMENYLSARRHLWSHDDNPYLLAGSQGPLSGEQVRRGFRQAVRDMGLDQPRRVLGNLIIGRPVPHSLRHTFAVNTLLQIKQRGGSPQQALPVLADYLGHSEYKYTAVYLRVADALSRNRLVDFALWQIKKV